MTYDQKLNNQSWKKILGCQLGPQLVGPGVHKNIHLKISWVLLIVNFQLSC